MTADRTNPVFAELPTTIFTVMSAAATEHGALNLGQGFPDADGPLAIREAAAKALLEGPNQYPPSRGLLPLRKAIAAHAKRFYALDFDPERDVLITSGATEALTSCIMGLVGKGGEIVLIEPAYDSYRPIAEAVGAVVKTVVLSPPHWRLTEDALRAAVSGKTSAILINTPLNPIGRVFDRGELNVVATIAQEFGAAVICDEVYEHLVFDGKAFEPLMTFPGMRERCVRVGSAGKMFSLTGWKIGWVSGPAALVDVVSKAHQFLTFTTSPALQLGIAHALDKEMDFTLNLTKELQANRDLLAEGIAKLGFKPLTCEGSYFLTADITGVTNESDIDFCKRLVREAGVAVIPLSVFFEGGKPDHLVRFAFCKSRTVLEDALARLQKYFHAETRRRGG